MSEVFTSYEREFDELAASIRKKTQAAVSSAGGGRRSRLEEVDAEISEADALVRGARPVPSPPPRRCARVR